MSFKAEASTVNPLRKLWSHVASHVNYCNDSPTLKGTACYSSTTRYIYSWCADPTISSVNKLSYQLLTDNPQTYLFMITRIVFRGQMLLYSKGWNWSNTTELTDEPAKPPAIIIATSVVAVGSSLLCLFTLILIVSLYIVCIYSSHLRLCLSLSVHLYMTSYHSHRVFMPVQRARSSWATTSPLHSPPQQTTEDPPCIPAPATAAYRLWAGEQVVACTKAHKQTKKCISFINGVGWRATLEIFGLINQAKYKA